MSDPAKQPDSHPVSDKDAPGKEQTGPPGLNAPRDETRLPKADAREALMRQVLASRTFAKSVRLSQFLEFVCRKAIEGHSDQINEQQIGIHVFGRSPAYSATDDSIVRTQARLLRQRLEEYFEHECPACPMIVLIPKGGYVPVFEPRPLLASTGPSAEPGSQHPAAGMAGSAPKAEEGLGLTAGPHTSQRPGVYPPPSAAQLPGPAEGRKPKTRRWIAGGLLVLALLAVAVILVRTLPRTGDRSPLWQSIFASGRPVVIVPSDDGLVLSEELRHAPVTLDEYLSGSYLREAPLRPRPDANGAFAPHDPAEPNAKQAAASPGQQPDISRSGGVTAAWLASHQYTSTADLALAMRLNRLPEAASGSVETRYARVLHLEELKDRNVILIGGIGANPWVGLFSHLLNFDVNYDWKAEQGYVINKHSVAGEKPIYREQYGDGAATSYGVLAYLPGLSGNGSALLFEGSGMAGTEAASDFPFSGEAFTSFLKKLGGHGSVPFFEVLLETRSLGGDASSPRVVAWRLISP